MHLLATGRSCPGLVPCPGTAAGIAAGSTLVPGAGVTLVARTVRGIERVVAEEIRVRGLGRVLHVRHREVWFLAPGLGPLDLRTADDVFLVGAVVDGVARVRDDLRRLAGAARALPARRLLGLRARCGQPAAPVGIEVVASFLGRRNYGRYDLEDAVGEQLAAALGLPYHSRRGGRVPPDGCASWRVTLEAGRAMVGLRLAARPLHRRAYRQASVPGSLHPPLAATLAWLAAPGPGLRVLDPCCGAGTVLIEARRLQRGARLLGADLDPLALRAAVANASAAGVEVGADGIAWTRADAGRLPFADGAIDRVVSNPPWRRQASAAGTLAGDPARFWREVRRVLTPDGRATVLLDGAGRHLALAGARAAGLDLAGRQEVSLAGRHPAVVTLVPRGAR